MHTPNHPIPPQHQATTSGPSGNGPFHRCFLFKRIFSRFCKCRKGGSFFQQPTSIISFPGTTCRIVNGRISCEGPWRTNAKTSAAEAPPWALVVRIYDKPSKTWHVLKHQKDVDEWIPSDAKTESVVHLLPPVSVSCPFICLNCQADLDRFSDENGVCIDIVTGAMEDESQVSVDVTRRYCSACWPTIRRRETIDKVGTFLGLMTAIVAVIAGIFCMVIAGFVLVWVPVLLLAAVVVYYVYYYVFLGPLLFFYGVLTGVYSDKEIRSFCVNNGIELVCQNPSVARAILHEQVSHQVSES